MTIQETAKLYTADELWEISARDTDHRYELNEGELVVMSPSGDAHGLVAAELLRLIANYVDAHDLGDVTAAETGYVLSNDPVTVRAPDVGMVVKARLPTITGHFYAVPPDLAVEVVSPGDTAAEIRHKAAQYLRAGTKLIWFVYPDDKLVDFYQPGQPTHTFEIDAVVPGGDVLPGFSLPVRDIFRKLRE